MSGSGRSLRSCYEIDRMWAELARIETGLASLRLRYSEVADDEVDAIGVEIDDLSDQHAEVLSALEDEGEGVP